MKLTFICLLLVVLLSACSTTIPVVEPMVSCTTGLSDEALTVGCTMPKPLTAGATFEDALKDSAGDKTSLLLCVKQVRILQGSLQHCNDLVKAHNEVLKGLGK